VSGSWPAPVERDSRGILDPWLLRQRVHLTRYPAGEALAGVVDRFWAVRWDLPPGTFHRQQVLTHPAANVSVGHADARDSARDAARREDAGREDAGHDGASRDGPVEARLNRVGRDGAGRDGAGRDGAGRDGDVRDGASRDGPVEARLNGVARRLTTRVLAGQGWAVAAMARPGGLGAFLTGSAADFTDKVVPLGEAIGIDDAALTRRVVAAPDEAARVGLLAAALEQALDPARVKAASQVADVARLAETDRTVRRLADLCRTAGIGQRTLQRMFMRYAGVSPTWVIRRYRLQEAAEAVREGASVSWAEVAAALGYADQAHLTRDFRAAIGQTPAAYAEAQSPAS
jgi:AraC-like DNA-binding protein